MPSQAFYFDVWSKQADITEAEMIYKLPHNLRKQVVLHKLTRLTGELPLLSQAPHKAREFILANGEPFEATPGREICS